MKSKKKKWVKFRHKVISFLAKLVIGPYCKIKYNITIEKFREEENRQYLVLFNHQTFADQFFVGLAFKKPVYYVASEDLFSNGFVSKLLRFAVAPIPIKKQCTDVHAVINCIRVAKEGGNIALAPEGNRTYAGETVYINPAISGLAKKLGLPIAIFRIEGGYGVHPRWSDEIRKGKMKAGVKRVIEPEEYKSIPEEELSDIICKELYVDEGKADAEFFCKNSAEYLERAFYVCPECGLSEFESHGDIIECKKCKRKIKYLPNKELSGIGFEFPFRFTTEWFRYQCDFMNSLDPMDFYEKPMYSEEADFYEVEIYRRKILLQKGAKLRLFGNRLEISIKDENLSMDFEKTAAMSAVGRNKINIYYGDKIYQIKSGKRFNALKYVNLYYRFTNIRKGEPYGKFLGL